MTAPISFPCGVSPRWDHVRHQAAPDSLKKQEALLPIAVICTLLPAASQFTELAHHGAQQVGVQTAAQTRSVVTTIMPALVAAAALDQERMTVLRIGLGHVRAITRRTLSAGRAAASHPFCALRI